MLCKYKVKKFLCKSLNIKRKYYLQPFVYVEDGKQVEMSNTIVWLDRKTMYICDEDEAMNKWNKYLVEKYGYNDEWIYYI